MVKKSKERPNARETRRMREGTETGAKTTRDEPRKAQMVEFVNGLSIPKKKLTTHDPRHALKWDIAVIMAAERVRDFLRKTSEPWARPCRLATCSPKSSPTPPK